MPLRLLDAPLHPGQIQSRLGFDSGTAGGDDRAIPNDVYLNLIGGRKASGIDVLHRPIRQNHTRVAEHRPLLAGRKIHAQDGAVFIWERRNEALRRASLQRHDGGSDFAEPTIPRVVDLQAAGSGYAYLRNQLDIRNLHRDQRRQRDKGAEAVADPVEPERACHSPRCRAQRSPCFRPIDSRPHALPGAFFESVATTSSPMASSPLDCRKPCSGALTGYAAMLRASQRAVSSERDSAIASGRNSSNERIPAPQLERSLPAKPLVITPMPNADISSGG